MKDGTRGADAPKYDLAVVEGAILEVAAELHPQRLTAQELALRIVGDPADEREVETAKQAINNLHEFGLFREGQGDIVDPTQTTLHVVALLTK